MPKGSTPTWDSVARLDNTERAAQPQRLPGRERSHPAHIGPAPRDGTQASAVRRASDVNKRPLVQGLRQGPSDGGYFVPISGAFSSWPSDRSSSHRVRASSRGPNGSTSPYGRSDSFQGHGRPTRPSHPNAVVAPDASRSFHWGWRDWASPRQRCRPSPWSPPVRRVASWMRREDVSRSSPSARCERPVGPGSTPVATGSASD